MAKQTIDIGTAANDGTGDDLRTGATKINQNFTELFTDVAALKVSTGSAITGIGFDSGRIVFEGHLADSYETTFRVVNPTKDNTISLPDSTGTVALTADITRIVDSAYVALITGTAFDSNSTKVLIDANALDSGRATRLIDSAYVKARMRMDSFDGDFIPGLDSTYDLGSSTRKWKDLHLSGQTIHLGNTTITNDGSNLAFGHPLKAELELANSLEMVDNIIQSTTGTGPAKFRATYGFRFSTNDGVDLMSISGGNVYMGDSLGTGNYLHVNRATTTNINNAARKKGMIAYNTTTNKFNLKDSDGAFEIQRGMLDSDLATALVDSDYVRARAVEVDLRNYTVATVPTGQHGKMVFVTDGASGDPCLAIFDSDAGFYKRIALGTQIST